MMKLSIARARVCVYVKALFFLASQMLLQSQGILNRKLFLRPS